MSDNTPTTRHAGESNPRSRQNFSWGFILIFIVVAPVAVITALLVYFLFSIVKIHYKVITGFVLLYGLGLVVTGQAMNAVNAYVSSFLKMFPYIKEQAWGELILTLFLNQAPLSLFVGGIIGCVMSWWAYKRRPVWLEVTFRRTPTQIIRRLINIHNIQQDRGTPKDGRTLGVNYEGDRITQTRAESASHTFIPGASGTGKTTTMMVGVRDMIKRGESLVFVDMKGSSDIPVVIDEYCKRYGRRFFHWTMQNPDKEYLGPSKLGPAYYDPLHRGDATRRADMLISLREWTEEHYKLQTKSYLQKVLDIAIASPDPDPTMDSLKEAILLLDSEYLKKRRLPLVGNPRYTNILDAVNDEIEGAQDREAKSLLKTTKNHFTLLRNSTPGHWLRKDPKGQQDINLFDVAHAGDVVLFTVDSMNYEDTSRSIGNLIIQDIKTVSGELMSRKPDLPMNVIIDEFSAIGSDSISNLLARCREANVPVTLSTQSLGDLREVSEAFLDKLTGTIGSFIIHRANTEKDAEIYSGVSPKTPKTTYKESVEHSSGLFGGIGKGSATGSGSIETKMEPVVTPEEIQSLGMGEAIFISKTSDRVERVKIIKEGIIKVSNENDNSMDSEDANWRASGDDYVTGVDEETALKNRVDPTINPQFSHMNENNVHSEPEINLEEWDKPDNPYADYEEHPSNREAIARIFSKNNDPVVEPEEYREPKPERVVEQRTPRLPLNKKEPSNESTSVSSPVVTPPAPRRTVPAPPPRASNGKKQQLPHRAVRTSENGTQGVTQPPVPPRPVNQNRVSPRPETKKLPPLPPKRVTHLPKPPKVSDDNRTYGDWD